MYKVIIVDDEKLLRQGFIHMVDWSQYGFEIIGEASDGLEALELVNKYSPDIVVTDIRMPGMDGIELTRRLRNERPDIQIIVLSSYNDFDYVKETLQLGASDYILKPKMQYTDLVAAMDKAMNKKTAAGHLVLPVRQNQASEKAFLKNLITTQSLSTEAVKQQLDQYQIHLQEESLCCVLIQLEPPTINDTTGIMEAFDFDEAKEAIVTRLQSKFPALAGSCCFSPGEGQLILLCNIEAGTPANAWIGDIAQQIPGVQRGAYWVFVSGIFSGFDGISAAYARLQALSPYRFYQSPGSCLYEQDFLHRVAALDLTLKHFNESIEKLEISGLYERLEASVTARLAEGCYVEPFAVKNGFIEACYYIIHHLEEMNVEIHELNSRKMMYFKNLERSQNLEECFLHLRGVLEDIQSFAQASRNMNYHTTIQSIVIYMQCNYHEDISLQSVAEQFHLNKSYLSQLFKQQTSENFNTYLAQIRITKAKELLRQPGHNINKVCEATGFTNPSYFGQVFKKIVGMKPSEYSKLYTK
ncbi:response regulator transcription factor [Paenibacillus chitinolyticus]|uniref:response regulator n=1 Tax=Paenibacillus chitinolyticus TaxID=79263 RepID=UPI001C47DE73|nr:response regulator transcription factor [Paenibacillus chitinolyticus]MBV6713893.1 response regulator transcription factor [Paenibacillus chitinolyticus]